MCAARERFQRWGVGVDDVNAASRRGTARPASALRLLQGLHRFRAMVALGFLLMLASADAHSQPRESLQGCNDLARVLAVDVSQSEAGVKTASVACSPGSRMPCTVESMKIFRNLIDASRALVDHFRTECRRHLGSDTVSREYARLDAHEATLKAAGEALEGLVSTITLQGPSPSAAASASQTPPPASAMASDADRSIGKVIKDCNECPSLVVLPPGTFRMGSDESEKGRDRYEEPAHNVRIHYLLAVGQTEVTRGEFAQFVRATGYRTDAERHDGCATWTGGGISYDAARNWRKPGFPQDNDHPVVCVTWADALAYIRWLNDLAPDKDFRLLTEAEWEYAARALGGDRRFPWGDDLDNTLQCAWANGSDLAIRSVLPIASRWTTAACDDGHGYTAPVKSKRLNAFGLYDMHGNAAEWVQDWLHDTYRDAPSDGSAWTRDGRADWRVRRGGAWYSSPDALRSANRGAGGFPNGTDDGTGFRIARRLR